MSFRRSTSLEDFQPDSLDPLRQWRFSARNGDLFCNFLLLRNTTHPLGMLISIKLDYSRGFLPGEKQETPLAFSAGAAAKSEVTPLLCSSSSCFLSKHNSKFRPYRRYYTSYFFAFLYKRSRQRLQSVLQAITILPSRSNVHLTALLLSVFAVPQCNALYTVFVRNCYLTLRSKQANI